MLFDPASTKREERVRSLLSAAAFAPALLDGPSPMADQGRLPMNMRRLALVPLAAGAAAACALAPPDDLAREVNRYYAAHASEENGACRSPEIASVIERTLRGDLVTVRYTYYEPGEAATDWSSVFHKPVACTGTGERQFTVERTKIGLEVVDMTGPRRD
jgi:hypothetical protein